MKLLQISTSDKILLSLIIMTMIAIVFLTIELVQNKEIKKLEDELEGYKKTNIRAIDANSGVVKLVKGNLQYKPGDAVWVDSTLRIVPSPKDDQVSLYIIIP